MDSDTVKYVMTCGLATLLLLLMQALLENHGMLYKISDEAIVSNYIIIIGYSVLSLLLIGFLWRQKLYRFRDTFHIVIHQKWKGFNIVQVMTLMSILLLVLIIYSHLFELDYSYYKYYMKNTILGIVFGLLYSYSFR